MGLPHSEDRLHHSLSEITRLLDRHRLLEALAHQQDSPRRDLVEQLQHRQNVAELGKRLRVMHAADIAHVLEGLPLNDRTTVWHEVAAEQAGDVLVEVSSAVRGSLIDSTDEPALIEMLARLDPEDLASVSARRCPARVARQRGVAGVAGVGPGHADRRVDARTGGDLQPDG